MRAISGAVKLLCSPPNSDRMPRPWASAGTMYLFSLRTESVTAIASIENKAAVDRHELPRHEAGTLPEQEDHEARDVLRLLRALHGAAADIDLLARLRHVLGRLDQDQARSDRVHGDAVGTKLTRQRARHRDHRALAADVMQQPRRAPQRGVGGEIDD